MLTTLVTLIFWGSFPLFTPLDQIIAAADVQEIIRLNELLNSLHDNLISFHNRVHETRIIIENTNVMTIYGYHTLHNDLSQIIALIENYSSRLNIPLQVLYNLDPSQITPEIS